MSKSRRSILCGGTATCEGQRDHFCQWMLEKFSYNDATVMMAPASGFYATAGAGKNEVRIAYVLKEDDLKAALEILAEGLKAYGKEWN